MVPRCTRYETKNYYPRWTYEQWKDLPRTTTTNAIRIRNLLRTIKVIILHRYSHNVLLTVYLLGF